MASDNNTHVATYEILNYFRLEIGLSLQGSNRIFMSAYIDVLYAYLCLNPIVVYHKTYILMLRDSHMLHSLRI